MANRNSSTKSTMAKNTSGRTITKVVRVPLICCQFDKDGNEVDYKKINEILWEIQRQTRQIKNRIIQLCWEWKGFSSDYVKREGVYPKDKEILDLTLSGYIQHDINKGVYLNADNIKQLNSNFILNTANIAQTVTLTLSEFNNAYKDIMTGNRSIISYKADQPLDLHNNSIRLSYENGEFYVNLSLLNRTSKNDYNFAKSQIRFKIYLKSGCSSERSIIERCCDDVYKITASKLIYNKKKKMWYLNLGYQFVVDKDNSLDKCKILGVDLGIVNPIVASVYGDYNRFIIKGDEITEFRKRVENRKKQLLHQGKYCGDGRIGHGIKTRNKPAYNIEDRIARFRDTVNHKYSKALIDYAIKNNCGVIQMEDLTGIANDKNDKFLKNWTYFDLQTKIEYKAKEAGIDVIKVPPKYTSQRCSKCGHICKENREIQSLFQCVKCGFKANADYNASQNLSIPSIDKIIKEEYNKSEIEDDCANV